MYKIYDSLIWFLTINRKWENSKDKKQVLQNKITIYTKNSTMKDMMRRAVGDTVLVAWRFGPDGLQPPVGGELQTKFVCGVGEVGHSFCLLAWSPWWYRSQSASQQSRSTAVCFCPMQQSTKWRRRRGGWTQLMQWRSASSVKAGPLKQWPKCFLTYSSLGKDYDKIIQKLWHILSSDPKPEHEFTKNVQASSWLETTAGKIWSQPSYKVHFPQSPTR